MLTEKQKNRKKEIYEDIIERRGPLNPLTKSQKKHLKKVAKKRMKSEERKARQMASQEASGKLIEESHNGGDYSPEFTNKAADWLVSELKEKLILSTGFLSFFRTRRVKYQTLLLKWSPETPRDYRFEVIKALLETYWDNKEDEERLKKTASGLLGGS